MPATRPLRILVVDDDPAMVGAITALVGTEGHQVITAYDGLTAVKRFREERPDIVLLDLAMPGPDGFTVAGQMRAAGSAPILVVSGESSSNNAEHTNCNWGGAISFWPRSSNIRSVKPASKLTPHRADGSLTTSCASTRVR